jgi:PAS domain S-box-containing protein
VGLALLEEPDDLHVDEAHFTKVEHDLAVPFFRDQPAQISQMPGANPAAQVQRRRAGIRCADDPEHRTDDECRPANGKIRAVRKLLSALGARVDCVRRRDEGSRTLASLERVIDLEWLDLVAEDTFRLIVETIPGLVAVMTSAGEVEHVNRQVLDYFGRTLEELKQWGTSDAVHPADLPEVIAAWQQAVKTGLPYEVEHRIRRFDGEYRWFQSRGLPLRDDGGHIVRWYNLLTDIHARKESEEKLEQAFDEIKRLKDRLQDENLALREEIDQALMFEELVGASAALKTVVSHVAKVAPTDSTVLISGETGTGKELIARAIHRHSRRAERAFVSLNCAATPPSLIASELFGHEKGAFTGAVQQRRGRFELAHSGTIFLDEVGEMPMDTQIALLRVLQEHQIERVGGSRAIAVDVRVIAATNRDLSQAIAAGTFRSDLFYRLNVFPIDVPPLRRRREDIAILVEYFVKRFAEKLAKRIRHIDRRTLELCERYAWPGNIRELQNIVERSVILCSGDTLSIDEAWLSGLAPLRPGGPSPLPDALEDQEKVMIEAALAKSKGRVAGPRGAAVTLGIPPSTLESKIKQLKIEKRRFT